MFIFDKKLTVLKKKTLLESNSFIKIQIKSFFHEIFKLDEKSKFGKVSSQ